jgi:hypothetical protein
VLWTGESTWVRSALGLVFCLGREDSRVVDQGMNT